jgi:hypothetical protein
VADLILGLQLLPASVLLFGIFTNKNSTCWLAKKGRPALSLLRRSPNTRPWQPWERIDGSMHSTSLSLHGRYSDGEDQDHHRGSTRSPNIASNSPLKFFETTWFTVPGERKLKDDSWYLIFKTSYNIGSRYTRHTREPEQPLYHQAN